MEGAHTPEPWFVVEAESMKYCSVVEFAYGSGARGTIALVGTDGCTIGASNLDEQNANARLISLAPNMRSALLALIAIAPANWDDPDDREQFLAWAQAREVVGRLLDLPLSSGLPPLGQSGAARDCPTRGAIGGGR